MKTRSLDLKNLMSYPDGFDVIKVTNLIADAKLEIGMIVAVTAVDAEESGLPEGTQALDVITITEETTLLGNDAVSLVGFQRIYSGIQIMNKPTFSDNITDIVVAGEGKNLSVLNAITTVFMLFGYFQKVQIPVTSTDMIVIAYK